MFSKLVGWLSKRFPEKLELTKHDYTELRQEVAQLNVVAQQIHEIHSRLQKVEKDVTTLSVAQGFVQPSSKGFGHLER